MGTLKTACTVAAAGVAGLIALKLLAALALPLLGMLFGLLGLALKVGLVAGVGYLVYRLVRRRRSEAPA